LSPEIASYGLAEWFRLAKVQKTSASLGSGNNKHFKNLEIQSYRQE
jgi:hypothetical protein